MTGLVCSDDPERVAACLRVTEQLVRQHPGSAEQVRCRREKNKDDVIKVL